jgi:hypothetical protein
VAVRPETDDAPQTAHAAAAEKAQQHGFELIVAVMRREQHVVGPEVLGESPITRVAGRGLEARTAIALDGHPHSRELDAERTCYRGAMVGPLRGLHLQAVIDVHRANARRKTESAKPREQHGGIEAAAESDDETRRDRGLGPARDRRAQFRQERLGRRGQRLRVEPGHRAPRDSGDAGAQTSLKTP